MKIKLDENLPARLRPLLETHGHDVHTVPGEQLTGRPDADIWQASRTEGRFLITQDLDFSDTRWYAPGTHPGLLLIRLREPGSQALVNAISAVAVEMAEWAGCFVVLTENKVRVKRPQR
jgi:predicted nuclease of predicted toxin-antitoxin system